MTKIAVLDTGINLEQNEKKYIKCELNFTGGHNILDGAKDDNGHGTACTKLILENNDTARIYAFKVLNSNNVGNLGNLVRALRYLVDIDIDIVNMSLDFVHSQYANDIKILCKELANQGKILISAADNRKIKAYPAAFKSVIGVGGYNFGNNKVFVFYPDKEIQILADNNPIVLEWKDRTTTILGGTSKATAIITNIISKYLQMDGRENVFKNLMEKTFKLDRIVDFDRTNEIASLKQLEVEKHDPQIIQNVIDIIPCSSDKKSSLYEQSLYSPVLELRMEDYCYIINKILNKYNIHISAPRLAYDLFYSIYTLEEFIREELEK